MSRTSRFLQKAERGFTLVELLVVITVISILLAFSAPALFSGLQASRLGGAGERMLSTISEAQQLAFSQNCTVELQIYSYATGIDDQVAFRSCRLFKVTNDSSGKEKVASTGAFYNFPEGVRIVENATLSPAFAGSLLMDTQKNSGANEAKYAALRFLPDGTCRKVGTAAGGQSSLQFLSLSASYFTLVDDDGSEYGGDQMPKNFYTIQVDPYTGKARSYRPGF